MCVTPTAQHHEALALCPVVLLDVNMNNQQRSLLTVAHAVGICCAVLYQGDITLKLFPDECPRTIENFTTHARNGYYDNVIFHRVIKGFMLQTGDPLG